MNDKVKNSKLVRMTFGGLEQLPSFSGNEEDYAFIKRVTFRGVVKGKKINLWGLSGRDKGVLYDSDPHNPKDADEFLAALDGVLENQGWYLTYTTRDRTAWRKHQRVEGALYSRK